MKLLQRTAKMHRLFFVNQKIRENIEKKMISEVQTLPNKMITQLYDKLYRYFVFKRGSLKMITQLYDKRRRRFLFST